MKGTPNLRNGAAFSNFSPADGAQETLSKITLNNFREFSIYFLTFSTFPYLTLSVDPALTFHLTI